MNLIYNKFKVQHDVWENEIQLERLIEISFLSTAVVLNTTGIQTVLFKKVGGVI